MVDEDWRGSSAGARRQGMTRGGKYRNAKYEIRKAENEAVKNECENGVEKKAAGALR
jgi:hypothetical protein